MPELPDITVYVERLRALARGERLESMRITCPFALRTVGVQEEPRRQTRERSGPVPGTAPFLRRAARARKGHPHGRNAPGPRRGAADHGTGARGHEDRLFQMSANDCSRVSGFGRRRAGRR